MSAARNAGLARARNDIVLLTDDDCLISPEWAERLPGSAMPASQPSMTPKPLRRFTWCPSAWSR